MKIARLIAITTFLGASQGWAIESTGWTCSNTSGCGNSTTDGVVTNAPVTGTTGYAWVTTQSDGASPASFDLAKLPSGVPTESVTNGATFTSQPFAVAAANSTISFQFNYVTSDGGTFSDFAWSRLLDSSGNEVALLFTARTDAVQSVVPGKEMPPSQATLTPPSVPIIAGAPNWTPLGTNLSGTGQCYSTGCGYSGWVEATYIIPNPGAYRLEIGVVNWADSSYQSGLAVDGLLVAGLPPSTLALNNPGTLPALTAPLYSGSVANPGLSATVDLVIAGPDGYTETLQASIQPDNSYSSQGAALQPGVYTIVATITGTDITQTQIFEVLPPPLAPSITLANPGDLPANTSPTYTGAVTNPGTAATVDLTVTGPDGYFETIQTDLNPDNTYSTPGAALPVGEYTVTATLTGTDVSQTTTFNVYDASAHRYVAPVPMLNFFGLGCLSALLAALGLARRK